MNTNYTNLNPFNSCIKLKANYLIPIINPCVGLSILRVSLLQ